MSDPKSLGVICAGWWHQTFGNDDGAARMTRARLRRSATPAEALVVEAVHDLNARFRAAGYRPGANRLALVAIVLAHVNANDKRKLAEAFGQRRSKDGPRALTELRLQTLIRTTDPAHLITPLRRAMAIVRHVPINVAALAADLYRWNEDTRTTWCFQYFGASNAVPERIPQEIDA